MLLLILGLILFLGMHSTRMVAPAWRDGRMATMGEGPWKGVYTLISFAGFALIIWGFGRASAVTPTVYAPPTWLRHLALLLMFFSFISATVSSFPAGRLKPALRHPLLLGVTIWALAHLLANGDLAGVILFGAFLVWAIANRISLERRHAPVPRPGPVKWDVLSVLVGAVLYGLFIWKLHLWLIGVSPLA